MKCPGKHSRIVLKKNGQRCGINAEYSTAAAETIPAETIIVRILNVRYALKGSRHQYARI
jgi:hypothetical protein